MGSGAELMKVEQHLLHKEILTVTNDRQTAYAIEALIVNDHFINREDTFNVRGGGESGGMSISTKLKQQVGIEQAKLRGAYTGRKKLVDDALIVAMKADGKRVCDISHELGISRMSVYRALSPKPIDDENLDDNQDEEYEFQNDDEIEENA